MLKLDRIDIRILHELQRNGRITNVELADLVHLSPSPCLMRVKKLQQAGYNPQPVAIDSHLTKLVGSLLPLVHLDDHPEDVQLGMAFQFSLPGDIEAFVRQHAPGARRIEFCHDTQRVVVREGWQPLGTQCAPDASLGDRVLPF